MCIYGISIDLPTEEQALIELEITAAMNKALRESESKRKKSRPPKQCEYHPQTRFFGDHLVCTRCGAIGHTAELCVDQLPSLEDLQKECQQVIDESSSKLQLIHLSGKSPTIGKDELGPVNIDGLIKAIFILRESLDNSTFCLNCGNLHPTSKCPFEPFDTLIAKLKEGNFLEKRHEKRSQMEIEKILRKYFTDYKAKVDSVMNDT